MRLTRPFRLVLGACALGATAFAAVTFAGAARAGHDAKPPAQSGPKISTLRALVTHYRGVTWTWERAAKARRTPTSYSERRSADRAYLQWTVDRWLQRAWTARAVAVRRIEHRLAVRLPGDPGLRAPLDARLEYTRGLALRLRRIYPGSVGRAFASATAGGPNATLRLWQSRSAAAAVQVALHVSPRPSAPTWLEHAFECIHHYEGAWNANTGNGYYGGLQMDYGFMSSYGAQYLRRWGTADNWPAWAQIDAAVHAYQSGRGFGPWPNTARACGLL